MMGDRRGRDEIDLIDRPDGSILSIRSTLSKRRISPDWQILHNDLKDVKDLNDNGAVRVCPCRSVSVRVYSRTSPWNDGQVNSVNRVNLVQTGRPLSLSVLPQRDGCENNGNVPKLGEVYHTSR